MDLPGLFVYPQDCFACMLTLTRSERKVLDYFACNMGRIIPFREWECVVNPTSGRQNLYTLITSIRRKIPGVKIENVLGVGYEYERELWMEMHKDKLWHLTKQLSVKVRQ